MIDGALTLDRLSDLWLEYEAAGDDKGCDRVLKALMTWADRHPETSTSAALPMGLSDVSNLRNRKKRISKPLIRRGFGGITRRAKRKVRSAATLLEKKHGRGYLSFATVTLPALPDHELFLVCQQWHYIARRFKEEIQREMERAGLSSSEYLGVTEIQEKRYAKWGQVCLHIHALFLGRSKGSWWCISPEKLRAIWERILSSAKVLNRCVECPTGTRIEVLRKPADKEMAKYLSKGTNIISRLISDGKAEFIPSSWYQMARELGREVESQIVRLTSHQVDVLFDNLYLLKSARILDFRFVCFESPDLVQGGEVLTWKSFICGASGFWKVKNWKQFLYNSTEELVQAVSCYLESRRINLSIA